MMAQYIYGISNGKRNVSIGVPAQMPCKQTFVAAVVRGKRDMGMEAFTWKYYVLFSYFSLDCVSVEQSICAKLNWIKLSAFEQTKLDDGLNATNNSRASDFVISFINPYKCLFYSIHIFFSNQRRSFHRSLTRKWVGKRKENDCEVERWTEMVNTEFEY